LWVHVEKRADMVIAKERRDEMKDS